MLVNDFRYVITVERPTTTKDAYGGIVDSYVLHLTLRAAVKYGAGTKTIDNSEIFNTSTITVTCHYRDIVDTDRIIFQGYAYKILDIADVAFREGMQIVCEKINL